MRGAVGVAVAVAGSVAVVEVDGMAGAVVVGAGLIAGESEVVVVLGGAATNASAAVRVASWTSSATGWSSRTAKTPNGTATAVSRHQAIRAGSRGCHGGGIPRRSSGRSCVRRRPPEQQRAAHDDP